MPRTKGSKNKPKVTKDYATQIAEKQERQMKRVFLIVCHTLIIPKQFCKRTTL